MRALTRALLRFFPGPIGTLNSTPRSDDLATAYPLLYAATLPVAAIVPIYTESDHREFIARVGLRFVPYTRLNWAACLVIGEKP